jgi:hypothetical protein
MIHILQCQNLIHTQKYYEIKRKKNQQIDMNLGVHIKYSLVSIIDNCMSG